MVSSLGKIIWVILWALCGCSTLWSSQLAFPDMEPLLLEWARARVIGAPVFWQAMLDVECLPCEWKLGKEGCPNFSAIFTRHLASSTWSGRECEVLVACLSQWDMITLGLELRGKRDLSSWPHAPGGKLPLNPGGWWGRREWVLAKLSQILAILTEF